MNPIVSDLEKYTSKTGWIGFFWAFFFSPGFLVIFLHRLAVFLYKKGWWLKLPALLVWRVNVLTSGCHIAINSKIGGGLHLPHPVGIVIGDGVEIKENVTIYQNVTLGQDGLKGVYPIIKSGVKIFPNSVVVGGVLVGERTLIGACSFVNKDTEIDGVYVGSPAKKIH